MLLSGKAFNLEEFAVSSSTEYELGNVLWKEAKKRKSDFKEAAQIFSETLLELKKVSINGISDILTLSLERNLTFYDASYAHIAEKEGLTLVTEDSELLEKCKCAIKIRDIKNI